jgi:KEOPS complex subunit Cgi121
MIDIFGFHVNSPKLDKNNLLNLIQQISKDENVFIQVFNASLIYGKDHIVSAYEHAARAFSQKRAISESMAMEILLYASGEYQIKNALIKLGLNEETKDIALIVCSENDKNIKKLKEILTDLCKKFDLIQDNDVLTGTKNTLEQFGITKEELSAVPENRWFDLVLEKVALVDIKK